MGRCGSSAMVLPSAHEEDVRPNAGSAVKNRTSLRSWLYFIVNYATLNPPKDFKDGRPDQRVHRAAPAAGKTPI